MRSWLGRPFAAVSMACCVALTTPHVGVAQNIPRISGAAVVTVPAPVPQSFRNLGAWAAGDSAALVRYRIVPTAGVRLVGRPTGSVSAAQGGRGTLPVTLSVSSLVAAGRLRAASVHFETPAGDRDSVGLWIEVEERRGVRVTLEPADTVAKRGERFRVRMTVLNSGNARDSVLLTHLTSAGATVANFPEAIAIPAFGDQRIELVVSLDPTLASGSLGYLRVIATGKEKKAVATTRFLVSRERGWFRSLVHVPTQVFVGSSVIDDASRSGTLGVVSVRSKGLIRADTELDVAYNSLPANGASFAFRGQATGPRFRAGIRSRRFEAAGGHLSAVLPQLLGFTRPANGVRSEAKLGQADIGLTLGRPSDSRGLSADGHVRSFRSGFSSPVGSLGVTISDIDESNELRTERSRVRSTLANYLLAPGGGHRITGDVGLMRVEDIRTGNSESGLAADMRYGYRGLGATLDVRARTLPATAVTARLPDRELTAIGTRHLSPTFMALASYTLQERNLLGVGRTSNRRKGEIGVRYSGGSRRYEFAIVQDHSARRFGSDLGILQEIDRVTVRAGTGLTDGNLHVDLLTEMGNASDGQTEELVERYRGVAYWYRSDGWVRLGASYTNDFGSPGTALIDLGFNRRLGPAVEAYGSLFLTLGQMRFGEGITFQIGSQVSIAPDMAVFAGIEALSGSIRESARWEFSVGVQRKLPLPLPIRRQASLEGTVFDDLNGSGEQERDEPGLAGIRLQMGREAVVTGPDGRYEFEAGAGTVSVRVDPGSLGRSFMSDGPYGAPDGRHLDIPLRRTGGARVVFYLDRDRSGVRDPDEVVIPGIAFQLVGEGDEAWALVAGRDGSATLNAIPRGTYAVLIDPETLPPRTRLPIADFIAVTGGTMSEWEIPVQPLPVRFGDPRISE